MNFKTIAAGVMIAGAALSIGSATVAQASPCHHSHGPVKPHKPPVHHHNPCPPPPVKPPVVHRGVTRHIVGNVTTPPATHAPNGANGTAG